MFFIWLSTLLVLGLFGGFHHIPPVAGLLLIPFAYQDLYDSRANRRR